MTRIPAIPVPAIGVPAFQVSLNGSRTAADGTAVPMSPEALAEAAARSVAAGATEVLVHPRTPCGRESLSPRVVGPVLSALRAAVAVPRSGSARGSMPVSVSVSVSVCASVPGEPDPVARIRAWEVLPDRATVDLAAPEAAAVAAALAERGVAVDGVLRLGAAAGTAVSGLRVARLLVECAVTDPAQLDGTELPGGAELLDGTAVTDGATGPDGTAVPGGTTMPGGTTAPGGTVVYGREAAAWPVLRWAAGRGHGCRTGIGDVLHLPDGRPARSNAELVAAAAAYVSRPDRQDVF
ncbi:3-keto-5-aminohexanoate cleavage protein [Streptomyces sp. NPDC051211]|uniref:3-keto-5-aminohexanoate cleavage protein n=1 Tax=Streptomyces sp. NPDC051211 TaxID=3154643 RepID=UPI00344F75D0